MSLRVGIVALIGGLLLSFAAPHEVRAANQQAMVDQISALTKGAFSSYSDGDLDKAKGQLLQAVAISKKDKELAVHPLMARTYLLLGVVYIDGFEDHKKGVTNFAKALKISPDIEIPEALATKTVRKAFGEAGGSSGSSAGPTETAEASGDTESSAPAEKDDKPKSAREVRQEREQAAREAREEKARAAREAKDEEDGEKETARAVLTEKKRAEGEAREREKEARLEKAQSEKALAQAKSAESKERAERERLQQEKEEKESQISEAKGVLTEAKQRLQQLEKDKAERDKQIAAGNERERKEREAKEKLEKEKVERDRLLAEVKQQLQQAQKDKAEKDKLIAAGTDREKKERDAKEKLEREKQASDAREKERRAQEESARVDREKLAAGPDLPGHVAEAIYCALPDEVQSGKDLFVHCAAGPNVKAKEIAIYYRPSGVAHYDSLLMERSKKGWYTTVIPAGRVLGKSLQYYVEARDSRDSVAGTNGKAQSPNILTLRAQGGPSIATGAHTGSDGALTPASSTGGKHAARAGGGRQERVKAR